MVKEIELKAHVGNSEALKRLLSEKAEYTCAFEKEDVYWYGGGDRVFGVQKIRVRKEKRRLADGTEESRCVVTYKSKERNDGFEVNDELEFEVNPAEGFEEFLGKAGLKLGARKSKRGWAFSKAGITAELVEVDDLGWFIELEILKSISIAVGSVIDNGQEEIIAEGKKHLLAFLDDLGIEREAIEQRFYLEMLNPTGT
jgi:predicted adenylyl cyclase CyaB